MFRKNFIAAQIGTGLCALPLCLFLFAQTISAGWDEATSMGLDSVGNIYVTGYSGPAYTADPYNYLTLKYDTEGHQLWEDRYGGPNTIIHDEARALAVDGSGNVYVTGMSNSDYLTIKYDSEGYRLWIAEYDISNDIAHCLKLDSSANVYVTGRTGSDWTTIKYDRDGEILWVANYLVSEPGGGPGLLAVDDLGFVYVGGHEGTVKYDPDGQLAWEINSRSYGRAVDHNGNCYLIREAYSE